MDNIIPLGVDLLKIGIIKYNDYQIKKKLDKEVKENLLKELKMLLNSILLHKKLCLTFGSIKYKEYTCYLAQDIENLNNFLIQNNKLIPSNFYDNLMEFLNYVLEYNHFINSLVAGCGVELKIYEDSIEDNIISGIKEIDTIIEILI